VTGAEAVIEQENIDNEMRKLARNWMAKSKLMLLPDHVSESTDLAMWKLLSEKRKANGSILVRLYQCPLLYKCLCIAGLRITEGHAWTQLDQRGTHDADSHNVSATGFVDGTKGSRIPSSNQAAELHNKALKKKASNTRDHTYRRCLSQESFSDDDDACPQYKAAMIIG
jgi:hypothetical protein